MGSDSNRSAKRPKGCPTGRAFWTLTPITAGSTWGSALRAIQVLKAKSHWWRCEWRRLQQPVSRMRNSCQQTDQAARPVFSCLCKAPASWEQIWRSRQYIGWLRERARTGKTWWTVQLRQVFYLLDIKRRKLT